MQSITINASETPVLDIQNLSVSRSGKVIIRDINLSIKKGEFVGLEATIKSKELFPDEPGNWAYYSFSGPMHKTLTETAKPFPTASCNSCHAGAAKDDFVFTQYYPVLTAGQLKGFDLVVCCADTVSYTHLTLPTKA